MSWDETFYKNALHSVVKASPALFFLNLNTQQNRRQIIKWKMFFICKNIFLLRVSQHSRMTVILALLG